jgi:hypothetical protein
MPVNRPDEIDGQVRVLADQLQRGLVGDGEGGHAFTPRG